MAEQAHPQVVEHPLPDERHRPEMEVLASVLEQRDSYEDGNDDVQAGQVARAHVLVDDSGDHPRQRDHRAGVHHDGREDKQ